MALVGHPKPLTAFASVSNHLRTNPKYHPEVDRFEVDDFGIAMICLRGGIVLNSKLQELL